MFSASFTSTAILHSTVVGLALLGAPGCSGGDGSGGGVTGLTEPDSGTPGAGGGASVAADGGTGGGSPAVAGPPLPAPTGACPDLADGMVTFTAGGNQRQARIYIDPAAAASLDGPLVFYWYGTGGQPTQAESGLGRPGIDRITAAGGIVVAPVHISTGGGIFPWLSGGPEDIALFDEVVACADEKTGIDSRAIHSVGFSAGALFTARLSFERARLMASVATYSGGGGGTPQQPDGNFAAMLLYGGPGDTVVLSFDTASHDYLTALTGAGHFAFLCNHGGGHKIPADAVPSVVDFLFAHPYGTAPSPYAAGLPAGFPSYCTL